MPIYEFELKLKGRKEQVIKEMFAAPFMLREIMKIVKPRVLSGIDASMFLLKYMYMLNRYISDSNRSNAIDLLKQLVIQWARCLPDDIAIEFEQGCSISKSNELYIPHIGLLQVKEPLFVQRAISLGRYKPKFDLILKGKTIYAQVEFIYYDQREDNLPRKKEKNVHRIGVSEYIKIFDKVVEDLLRYEAKISKNYTKTDFAKLEGRSVQGGAPSLGKKNK